MVEGFAISPQLLAETYAADLDLVAQLGARSICAISLDKDLDRATAQFATLAQMASERGVRVTTEVGAGVIRDIQIANEIWQAVAHSNFTLLLDAMHFFRKGGTITDLNVLANDAIGHVQICDVPMPAYIESYMEEAMYERRCPGDGDLPLREFLARISPSVPIGIEVPIRSATDALDVVLQKCLTRTSELLRCAQDHPLATRE